MTLHEMLSHYHDTDPIPTPTAVNYVVGRECLFASRL